MTGSTRKLGSLTNGSALTSKLVVNIIVKVIKKRIATKRLPGIDLMAKTSWYENNRTVVIWKVASLSILPLFFLYWPLELQI